MKLRTAVTTIALLGATFAATPRFTFAADAAPPAEPIPRMEPQKIGPQAEAVDLKAYAKVLKVSAAGGGDFKTIQDALAAAGDAAEGKRYAILVGAGEYKGQTVEMKPFVDLFGGFDAKTWKRGDTLDANRTTLDGEGQRRVVVAADQARIDGFVIRSGKVRGPGAGILCDHVSPTISNNTIIANATLEPEGFHKDMLHQHGNDGAAVACINGSSPTIANNVIAQNTTQIGGGAGIAASNYSMPRILNNVLCGNESGLADGEKARNSNGAAISATNAQIRPPLRMVVANNVIANNRANGKSDAGGIYLEYDSSPVIASNWILGNWCGDDGSGIYVMKNSHPLFSHNIVAGNNSSAIRLSKEGRGDVEHNLVFDNAAAVICISSWMNFRNNTIVENKSGLSYGNPYAPHLKPSLITGNVFYNNGGGQLGSEGAEPPVVKGNIVQGGYNGGEGNVDTKPQFANDGGPGDIASLAYDDQRGVTTIGCSSISGGGGEIDKLTGRIVKIGDRWGVIRKAGNDKIEVWGDLRPAVAAGPQPKQFSIAPTYTLLAPLASGVGSDLVAKP